MRRQIILGLVFAAATGLGMPVDSRAQTPLDMFEGQPTYKAGKALGYFIWKDRDTWKIRWMTFGSAHKFTGRVVVEGGQILSFKRIDVDVERQVLRPGYAPRVVRGPRGRVRAVTPGRAPVVAERTEDKIEQESEQIVQWLTETDDDIDGVDVKVTNDATALRFNLMIDGQPKPLEVEIGKSNFKPGVNPVRVVLK